MLSVPSWCPKCELVAMRVSCQPCRKATTSPETNCPKLAIRNPSPADMKIWTMAISISWVKIRTRMFSAKPGRSTSSEHVRHKTGLVSEDCCIRKHVYHRDPRRFEETAGLCYQKSSKVESRTRWASCFGSSPMWAQKGKTFWRGPADDL